MRQEPKPGFLGIPEERWGAPEHTVRSRLACGSYVSLRYRYVYVETPKVACTSIKTFIHWLEGLPPMPEVALCDSWQPSGAEAAEDPGSAARRLETETYERNRVIAAPSAGFARREEGP